jgi:hypothetical protein
VTTFDDAGRSAEGVLLITEGLHTTTAEVDELIAKCLHKTPEGDEPTSPMMSSIRAGKSADRGHGAQQIEITPDGQNEEHRSRLRRLLLLLAIVNHNRSSRRRRGRSKPLVRQSLIWQIEIERLSRESQFEQCYRMSSASFEHLLTLVGPALQRDPHAWMN